MPPTLDRQQQTMGAREANRLGHLSSRDRLDHERRPARDRPVPDPRCHSKARIAGKQQRSLHLGGQGRQCVLCHLHRSTVEAGHPNGSHVVTVRSSRLARIGCFPMGVVRQDPSTRAWHRARHATGCSACGRSGPDWLLRSWR